MLKHKSFLKWAGGKYRCLHEILPRLPIGERLIEPFTGSGVIFLNTHYRRYLMADTNADLIDLYRCLQKKGEPFIEQCRRLFSSSYNTREAYHHLRQQFNDHDRSEDRAKIFLYLNRHGYNGLCRYNQKGGYNVPFGYYASPYFPDQELSYFVKKSENTTFIHADFQETFAQAQQGDVIYCDPPYAPILQKTNFTHYAQKGFNLEDHLNLTKLAIETSQKGIPVLISNHDTPFTRSCYQQGEIHSFQVQRSINRHGHGRIKVPELLVIFQ